MKPLSYSQISLYQQCPLHYKLQYVDGLEPKDKWFFSFGTVLHKCAEHFFQVPVPPPPSPDEMLKFYDDNWSSAGYASADEEYNYKAYGREVITRFCEIHGIDFRLPVATERSFAVDVGGVKLRGVIDRVDKLENGALSIVDYKTNKSLFTADYLENDLQLTLYQLAVEQIWGLPVSNLTLYHLRSNTPCSCGPRSNERLEEAKDLVKQVAASIVAGEFQATENQYCPCDFPEYCPFHRHKYGQMLQKDTDADILNGMVIEDAIERYVDLQNQVKTLEAELNLVRQMILDFCQAEDVTRVFGRSHAITYGLVGRSGYDEEEVKALLQPQGLWDKVLSFDQTKVKELLESVDITRDLKKRLQAIKHVMSQSPRLWVKELEEDE